MTINAVDEMGIKLDVPVVLNSVIVSDEFEGTFQERRFVIHTINLQMKVSLFGPQQSQGVITKSTANVSQGNGQNVFSPTETYIAEGNLETKEITDSWITDF